MNSVDLSPLYRSSIGFDGLSGLLDNALASTSEVSSYPAYNIEVVAENCYAITIAAAGFADDELNIQVEQGELLVTGQKLKNANRQYLHHGIITQSFERKFTLAEYVEVTRAKLSHGLLVIELVKTLPESAGATCIAISHPYQSATKPSFVRANHLAKNTAQKSTAATTTGAKTRDTKTSSATHSNNTRKAVPPSQLTDPPVAGAKSKEETLSTDTPSEAKQKVASAKAKPAQSAQVHWFNG
ncbi:hypothetical protein DXX93_14640 [Thalassotalea euphylliae]|uniref:SHSP domain-containing protein n=2 Tax=Thalassotalea euphylliae TaxID=1655234 RepID=A0A3E0TWZ1_9GAMM|nr:hypothetical protein DXX93_14640 [Thalassotalea euphylliae]